MSATTAYALSAMTLSEARRTGREPFLIDGLIASTLTLVHGKPKAGKSAFVQSLTAAILKGEPFLGRSTERIRGRILILASDSGSPREYATRIEECGVALDRVNDRVKIVILPELSVETVRAASTLLQPTLEDLLVVDHLSDFVGDMNSAQETAALMRAIDSERHGAPVIVVAHSSTSVGPNGHSSRKPLGSTAIEAKFRWLLSLEDRGTHVSLVARGNASHETTYLLTRGNHAADLRLAREVSPEEAAQARRQRSEQTQAFHAEVATFVRDHLADMPKAQQAKRLSEEYPGCSEASWKRHLARSGWLGKMLASGGVTG